MELNEMSEAERRARESCPCRRGPNNGCRSARINRCACTFPDAESFPACKWSGHALITNLAREAHLAGRLEQAEKSVDAFTAATWQNAYGRILDERDRLRALKEEKHGG